MLKHICISDCVVACFRELKVSLRTESGFKFNRALCGIKGCCVLMWRQEEAGCLSVTTGQPFLLAPNTQTRFASMSSGNTL